jgi:hypothetical protein
MQNYTQIPDSQRISDSLLPLLNNDQTGISRNAGDNYPTIGLVVGMPYYSTSQNKLFRLSSLSPLTWVVEIDYNRPYAYQDSVDAANANANGRVSRAGDIMSGFLTLSGDPTAALHAASKRYVDAQTTVAINSANSRVSRGGDSMSGFLTLYTDPQQPYHAATKNYVDVYINSLAGSKLAKNGDTLGEVFNNGWYRSNGAVGWYNQTYGGGIFQNQGGYVSTFGGTGFLTPWHTLEVNTGGIWTARYGWLENRFADKSAEGSFNSCGTLNNSTNPTVVPGSFYLQASGRQVQLVRTFGNCNCNCACTCFPAGTRILMGDKKTWRAVETLQVGEIVMTPTGPEPILEIETPYLGSRKMCMFADGSLKWTDDHAFWTRRDGVQGFSVVDKDSFMNGVEAGLVKGLKNHDDLLVMNDRLDEFAHLEGWKKKRVFRYTQPAETKVYLPIVGGSHMIIAEGFVVSAGMDEETFDYKSLDWKGMDIAHQPINREAFFDARS